MINSITVKNVASYSADGILLENLKPVSFIYGANGSGKTTISNFLATPKEDKYVDCNIAWEGDQALPAYVYNKEFREQNFFKSNIPGVFTLGKASAEQMKLLEEKKIEITSLRETAKEEKRRLKGFEDQLDSEYERLKETLWDSYYKPNKTNFSDAFKGCGTKESFKARLLKEFKSNSADLLTKEEILEQAKTIFGGKPQEISLLPLLDFSKLSEIEESDIWNKAIVGKADVPIAQLIGKLNNSDWVDKGQEFIEGEVCPFCQQETVNENLKKQLADFFDESYKKELGKVLSYSNEFKRQSQGILNQLGELQQREKISSDTKIDWEKFETEVELLESRLAESHRVMTDKLKEPSRKLSLTLLTDLFAHFEDQITNANKLIEEHNRIVRSFRTSHLLLIQSVWKYLIEEARPIISGYEKAFEGISSVKSKLLDIQKQTIKKGIDLKKEIDDLTAGTTGTEFSELEMNKILVSYGFFSFKVVKSPEENNCYQIQREDGTLVESTLSEGEVTFLTFLYFYQLAKGGHSEESVNERRILVVDDPISSLDSNVLFVVSSLLRKFLEDVRAGKGNINQLLLFTHNSYFHKQMAIVEGRNQEIENTGYWILRKGRKCTTIESHGKKNPISSTYELLWQELKSEEKKSSVMLQNAMRRILEYYFTVFGQFSNIKNLPPKFKSLEEQLICKSLISWVHGGSHDIADEIHVSGHDDSEQRYKDVFRSIFEVNGQLGHYNLMMEINEEILEDNQ
ncbi:AAA family ATPase [Algoriphagus aquimarinus]|uniref:AAA family ATPase n=1 Tax=Algoriphagus aquimarinus TaxID=237018 RepID=A0A5C7AFN1_9BACT|nr:AAA family ATPase [Algoriphagus aquimarinus]TXE07586.1 AAA family ATPase [Algoriphagus aquimarinus]